MKTFWRILIIVSLVWLGTAISPEAPRADAQNHVVFLPIIFKAPYEPEKGTVLVQDHPYCEDLSTLNLGWYKNNEIRPYDGCPSPDRRFVPRITHPNVANDPNLLTIAIDNAKASGWLIGYVEPNLPHQGVTPRDGALAWHKIEIEADKYDIKLVAPAPSQHPPDYFGPGTDPYGNQWIWHMIDEYLAEYHKMPTFDAFSWNFYDRSPSAFVNYFTSRRGEADTLYSEYYKNTPFWILEYAGTCWDSDRYPTGNTAIMNQVTPWFKNTPLITRYAWFANRIRGDEHYALNHQSCSLIDPDTGVPTSLGQIYAGY